MEYTAAESRPTATSAAVAPRDGAAVSGTPVDFPPGMPLAVPTTGRGLHMPSKHAIHSHHSHHGRPRSRRQDIVRLQRREKGRLRGHEPAVGAAGAGPSGVVRRRFAGPGPREIDGERRTEGARAG